MSSEDSTNSSPKGDCGQYFLRAQTFGACSGNAVECKAAPPNSHNPTLLGQCVCSDGWRGTGDLWSADGQDCNIHIAAIRWWWFCLSVLYLFVAFSAGHVLALSVRKRGFRKTIAMKQMKVMAVAAAFGVAKCVEGGLRAGSGKFAGEDLAITVLSTLTGFVFWSILIPGFLGLWITLCIGSANMGGAEGKTLAEKLKKMDKRAKYMVVVTFPAYLAIFLSYFFRTPTAQTVLMEIYFIGHGVIGAFFVWGVALPVSKYFLGLLVESERKSPDPKLAILKDKMSIMCREIFNNGVSNFLSVAIFAVCPFLWNYTAYQFCFGWTLGVAITLGAINLVKPPKEGGNKVGPMGGKDKSRPDTGSRKSSVTEVEVPA